MTYDDPNFRPRRIVIPDPPSKVQDARILDAEANTAEICVQGSWFPMPADDPLVIAVLERKAAAAIR